MISTTDIRVRYAETDQMGVVHHANYLLYFEDARTKFCEDMGFPYAELEASGYLSPVVSIECSYGASLVYGDVATVVTRVTEVRPAKLVYAYEIYRQGQMPGVDKPCATGRSTHCIVDAQTFKPVSMKRVAPELYARYCEVCEPET